MQNQIVDDEEKLSIATERLFDNAQKWFKPYYSVRLNYVGSTSLFVSKYNSVAARSGAKTKLYSEHQKPGELAGPFITTKRNLFDRLGENVPETEQMQIVANLLDPELSSPPENHTPCLQDKVPPSRI